MIVTDDDPHDEDPAADPGGGGRWRAGRNRRARRCGTEVLESTRGPPPLPRRWRWPAEDDTILVAGRGHEVFQEVMGVNLELDDRVELRRALLPRLQPLDSAADSFDPADEG